VKIFLKNDAKCLVIQLWNECQAIHPEPLSSEYLSWILQSIIIKDLRLKQDSPNRERTGLRKKFFHEILGD